MTKLLVTVGSMTSFDGLVEAVLAPETVAALSVLGYDAIFVQYGVAATSKAKFDALVDRLAAVPPALRPAVEGLAITRDLPGLIAQCDTVVSHAGAGTIVDVLRAPGGGKKLVVVANESLMDNHQTEVADALSAGGHLLRAASSRAEDVVAALQRAATHAFVPLPAPASIGAVVAAEAAVAAASRGGRLRARAN
ncbi:uncharacterized protein V1510DRAFT_414522 [Dipodascopsis tothii]|uniref:uncharacterized protein n=1 Tax=Dipodascopsis tothii TaxID=44089 RepID=UPI0034CDBC0B